MNEQSHTVDPGRPADAAEQEQSREPADQERPAEGQRVVVVTQDGMGVAEPPQGDDEERGARRNPADLVEQPAKVMRLGTMIKQLLEEVKSAPLDDAGRSRLAEIHRRSLSELEQGLAPELVEELERITLPLADDSPSEAELRIAQAQLVGWLEGLFHGIQTAIVAQQMAAQQQLQHMRLALPGGQTPGGPGQGAGQPIGPSGTDEGEPTGTGQYL
ncbi:bacterial proteasome activator family protein [Ornithinimicrobium ciconiae]|uniref:Bacterial proteasome activator n=1 Tax=Ornithinimicrobium ciconiae TaxID=2594265 RepID=A0A516G5W0_9MICO|nr:bacterial proteasome activator family protein [Ornithinimicrobium ciconiae]QDO86911.1 bacterial proteasome activator family protein [Ornithinimicrobium ciconiae]